MTTVYLPLPLRPINLSQEPYSFIRLGEDFRNQSYQPDQVFDLTNNYILSNTYFQVEVIGFYRNMLLVKPTEIHKLTFLLELPELLTPVYITLSSSNLYCNRHCFDLIPPHQFLQRPPLTQLPTAQSLANFPATAPAKHPAIDK